MPFKPFAHLARVSLAKSVTHAYAPSAVVAGQSLGQFHNTSFNKFSKANHLQNAFTGPSSSGAGAGAKTGHASQSTGVDSGLGQYYAAWQHAQQTGDDADFKNHQSARKIGWKVSDKTGAGVHQPRQRLDSIRAADILRPALLQNRGYSESAVTELASAEQAVVEAEALAKIDEAIAQEVKVGKELDTLETHDTVVAVDAEKGQDSAGEPSVSDLPYGDSEAQKSSVAVQELLPTDASLSLSEHIIELGRQQRYAEIPQHFEAMIKDGLVPTVEAYNQIIVSAIRLNHGYQPFPRALEVYGDMTSRSVAANQDTYAILISFLTKQGLKAASIQRDLAKQRMRYGSFVLPSTVQQEQLLTGDVSLQFAGKFYNIAAGTLSNFGLSASQFHDLLRAHAITGSAQNVRQVLSDMTAAGVPLELEMYTTIIDTCTSVRDIEMAKAYYAEYRDRAIGRRLEPLDVKVYVSLIRAFLSVGQEQKGIHFYEQILSSFQGSAERIALCQQVTDAFVCDGLVQHYVEVGQYQRAIDNLQKYSVSSQAKAQACNAICTHAADNNQTAIAERMFAQVESGVLTSDCVRAFSAMLLRADRIDDAQQAWSKALQSNGRTTADVAFATMYALIHMHNGRVEQGLTHVRAMFREIRSTAMLPSSANGAFDEAIVLFGQSLSQAAALHTATASIQLFRLMIENGGLLPMVAQSAIARIGPDCVTQLSAQDIALALHVQAHMLPTTTNTVNDTAQADRFCHLLETVLDRGILMDPSTLHAVTEALPRLNGARADLEQRWSGLLQPASQGSQIVSPTLPQSPIVDGARSTSSYDPYANTTDHRASRAISELLETTSGKIETHISDSMSRLRNVRRMGRHLQYSAYAKLITAAGKAKQLNLMNEVLGMAQTDVPFNAAVPSVKAGWIALYDAAVAACLNIGNRKLAAKYHEDIRSLGAAPSANTFGIYITTLEGTFDEATEAVKIFQQSVAEGVAPSVFLFNAVIGKLGKARRIDDCLHYFAQMQSLGIRPSSVTYGTLVNALCRTSEESMAVELFDEMEAAANYRPRPAPYNSIIQYFLNTKRDRTKVLQYYGRMRSKNIKPTSHTYKLLIEAYATLSPVNLTAAETLLEDMKANGIRPEAIHYGSLIHAHGCVQHDMTAARKVFDAVLADKAIRPTDNLYQNLLESMVANHEVDQSDDILVDMNNRGISMTPYIANTLIHGWAGKGDITRARAIYESLGNENREPSTYDAMARAFLAVEDHAGAQTVVNEMLKKGYPSAVTEKLLALVGGSF